MTQEKTRAETERDDDDCPCHARALDYGETTLPRATCTDALRQHGKRELDKFPILRRSLGSCYLVPNETINDRDHRKSGDTSHLFTIETMHGEEGPPKQGRMEEGEASGTVRTHASKLGSTRLRCRRRRHHKSPMHIGHTHGWKRRHLAQMTAIHPGARVKLGAVKSE